VQVPSFAFLGFALAVAVLINLSQARAWRNGLMLIANLAFLLSFSRSPVALAPLGAFVLGGYVLMGLLRRWPKLLLWPSMVVVLAAFFSLKRYTFLPHEFFLPWPYVAVGVSYIAFRILHLLIDTGQGVLKAQIALVDYLNYALSFPCIVAGPIQMYPDYQAGLTGRPSQGSIGLGLERIVLGMFKVFVISAALSAWHDHTTAQTMARASGFYDAVGAVAIYPVYLYFNFSGYTDVVIGAAQLCGLQLPENFDRPFTATNFIDFWNRWHITLSTWLRTYVYSPFLMTAMRRLPSPGLATPISIVAFFVTFFLVGAWHGQTSKFLFFGVLQGGGVAMNKLYQVAVASVLGRKGYRKLGDNLVYQAICRGLTFTWFSFTLLWFWSDWGTLGKLWAATGPAQAAAGLLAIWAGATVILALMTGALATTRRLVGDKPQLYLPYVKTMGAAVMTLAIVITVFVLSAPPPAIVYKAF
jgi:D-alanyl-lipoteichoic acid acyltransferase DltB (MBOAT superfamily)